MINDFPSYDELDITKYPLIAGQYTLGLVKHHRPDIEIIHQDHWDSYESYDWLDQRIQSALTNSKTVCLFVWDEDIGFGRQFADCVVKYQDCPVYVITQRDSFCMLYYIDQGIKNILEIPWWLLNDCLVYYKLCSKNNTINKFNDQNFLCMVNRLQEHKCFLIDQLLQFKDHGVITTTQKYKNHDLSTMPPYPKLNVPSGKTRANSNINGVWASANVENFLRIESTYKNIPLIINPDTNFGMFQLTEKSMWPLLLGRLMMVAGRHSIMESTQRFYDVDFSEYLNLDFDLEYHHYDLDHAELRIKKMINDNSNLIISAQETYKKLSQRLEAARWTLGKNFYNFFVEQFKKIPKGV